MTITIVIKFLATIFCRTARFIFICVVGFSKLSDINFLFLETFPTSVCSVNFLFFVMLGVQIISNGVTIVKFCDNFIFQYFPEKISNIEFFSGFLHIEKYFKVNFKCHFVTVVSLLLFPDHYNKYISKCQ